MTEETIKKMKDFLSEVKDRILADTPGFFKQIKKAALYITAFSAALIAAEKMGAIEFPDFVVQVCKYISFMGTTAFGVATTAKES